MHHPVGKGCYFDKHQLFNARTEKVVALPNWEWVEVDGNHIVWADDSVLYAGRVEAEGLGKSKLLFDFNLMTRKKTAAPH